MDDPSEPKRQILECIRLAEECLRLANQVQPPEMQIKLGQAAALLVEAADQLRLR